MTARPGAGQNSDKAITMAITDETFASIRRLRECGLTIRAIASQLRIGRSTVQQFLAGTFHRKKPKRKQKRPKTVKQYRCTLCRCLTTRRPCACLDVARVLRDDLTDSLGLELEGDEAKRLDEVRSGKWRPRRKQQPKPTKVIDPNEPGRLATLDLCWRKYPDKYPLM